MELHTQEMRAFVRSTEIGKKVSSAPLEEKMVHAIITTKKVARNWKDSKER